MYEVKLSKPDDFLKIKETLTRIGIANIKTKTLTQSCHILHKGGKYYIVLFKEMFELDGKKSLMSFEDQNRLRDITQLLINWNLCKPVTKFVASGLNQFRVISYKDKEDWNLVQKYVIGNK